MSATLQYLLLGFTAMLMASPSVALADDPPTRTAAVSAAMGIGFARVTIVDPLGGDLQFAIWYPATAPTTLSRVGPYEFAGTKDAEPARGPFALVALSHGTGGTPFGHRNIAIALANAGFIAVAPLHPRDNFADDSGVGHRVVWDGRPLQMSAVIDHMLSSSVWSTRIDADRIGAFGFSLGGYTVLALLGAKPDLNLLVDHCDTVGNADPLCQRAGGLATAMRNVIREEYQTPAVALSDFRICAAVVADPVAALFSEESLRGFELSSLQIYMPEHQNALAGRFHGRRVADLVGAQGRTEVEVVTIKAAQHYSFLTPFPAVIADSLPAVFKNRPEFDATRFHAQFETRVVDYFVNNLRACRRTQ